MRRGRARALLLAAACGCSVALAAGPRRAGNIVLECESVNAWGATYVTNQTVSVGSSGGLAGLVYVTTNQLTVAHISAEHGFWLGEDEAGPRGRGSIVVLW